MGASLGPVYKGEHCLGCRTTLVGGKPLLTEILASAIKSWWVSLVSGGN